MNQGKSVLRFIFYAVWAVLMTALTYVLGAVPLKVLRKKIGRGGYSALGLVLSVALYFLDPRLSVAFFSLVLLIGVFSELEDLGLTFMTSAFFTLVINSLAATGAFALWVYSTGPKWAQQVSTQVESWIKPLSDLNPQMQINYQDLLLQLPSIVLILWMGALYLAVLLENRLTVTEPGSEPEPTLRPQLADFRLPDVVIWVFIASLLAAFAGFNARYVEAAGVNVLNVCFMLFFFQGIAIVAKFFETLRMGLFWQFAFMVLIVVHLFLVVSLLGLMDYWLDFRTRLAKRAEELTAKRERD